MEAGDEMPFRLRQLLSMSTGFKMLGRSCKCSSNEIDLSAASKQIPAATKCLFATGLNGDCVNHSAVRGRCQEKFRSSIRQWHWNVAFSRMDSYIKPKIKLSLLSLSFFFLLSPPHLAFKLPANLVHEGLCKGRIYHLFAACLCSDGWAPGRGHAPECSAASPEPVYSSISGPREEVASWAAQVSNTRAQQWEPSKQLDHSSDPAAKLITDLLHKATKLWLNIASVQRSCNPARLSHLSRTGTADVKSTPGDTQVNQHIGGFLHYNQGGHHTSVAAESQAAEIPKLQRHQGSGKPSMPTMNYL